MLWLLIFGLVVAGGYADDTLSADRCARCRAHAICAFVYRRSGCDGVAAAERYFDTLAAAGRPVPWAASGANATASALTVSGGSDGDGELAVLVYYGGFLAARTPCPEFHQVVYDPVTNQLVCTCQSGAAQYCAAATDDPAAVATASTLMIVVVSVTAAYLLVLVVYVVACANSLQTHRRHRTRDTQELQTLVT